MKRTRKWAFVAQEATRLAGLGLSPVQIADRIGVKRSTVQRWMAAGKVIDTRRGAKAPRRRRALTGLSKPAEWAAAVRKDYALDATDEQLVTLAKTALGKALDPVHPVPVQLAAMRTFQGLVKQLALVARIAEPSQPKPDTSATPRLVRVRTGGDPRSVLVAS